MQTWRLINTGVNNGYYNMAVDEAIAIAVREGRVPSTLRFYTWDPPCVSIGYFQKHDESHMSPLLKRAEVDSLPFKGRARVGMGFPGVMLNRQIVRRITGGRAVFHGEDLSYSVVSGTDNMLFPKNINGTYATIANALIAGLRHFGIHPDPVEGKKVKKDSPTNYHKTVLCFNTAIRHEITVNGKKLIGSAQRRWPDVFLQHGSILVNRATSENGPASVSLEELAALSSDDLMNRGLTNDHGNPVCHPEFISGSQTMQEQEILKQVQNDRVDGLVASLSNGFSETLGIQFTTEDLSNYESELAEKLIADKYSKS